MTGDPPRAQRRPKVRSSCDGCGAAKLKCDRGQPECSRCVSYGIPCVYGISRRRGKPRRDRTRRNSVPTISSDSTRIVAADYANCAGADKLEKDGEMLDLGLFSNLSDYSDNGFEIGLGTLDDLHGDLMLEQSLPTLTPPDLGKWEVALDDLLAENLRNTSGYTATESSNFPSNTSSRTPQPSHDSPMPPASIRGHDCALEAHEILESLSFHHLSQACNTPPSLPVTLSTPATTPGGTVHQSVSLDHVLCLNREASENLNRLLNCSCAISPPLALLFASIISRILVWYQQAAGSGPAPGSHSQSTSLPSSLPWTLDTATELPTVLSPRLDSGSWRGSSVGTWSSMGASTIESSVSASSGAKGVSTSALTNITIGTFSVDDLGVQTALELQLLLGEMRRVGVLIDQFTSRGSEKCLHSTRADGGLDNLYQSLDQWLRGEHLRIAYGMKSKLRELNTG